MTVSNESFRTLQDSDGVALVYQADFQIQGDVLALADQVEVYEKGVLTIITYGISNVTPAGFTVTFVSAPASGTLSIVRKKRNTQESSYPVGNPFPPQAVEYSFDELTLQVQDIEAIAQFGLRQPIWEDKRSMEIPPIAERALRIQMYDFAGNSTVGDLLATEIAMELGTLVLAGATGVVTFVTPKASANYKILLQAFANETVWPSGMTTTGFTINSSNAGSAARVDWQVIE